jgi:hypothetical protein
MFQEGVEVFQYGPCVEDGVRVKEAGERVPSFPVLLSEPEPEFLVENM